LIKALFISILLLVTLNARENPFFPSTGEKDILVTTNEESAQIPLKSAAITLPTQARILQKVTLEFKNLDGSIETKSIGLDNSIDWHLPIFISQSYTEVSNNIEPQTAQAPQTVKRIEPQAAKTAQIAKPVEVKKAKETKYENIASFAFLNFFSSGKTIKLVTNDEAIRNFLLVNPHRIVVDFKKNVDVKSYTKNISNNIFKVIRIGNHEGYYRAVIELDGHYRYKFKKISDGYIVELK